MWMVYGSWSGGIFLLEIDEKTGLVIHPKEDEKTVWIRILANVCLAADTNRSRDLTFSMMRKADIIICLFPMVP